MLHCKVQLQVCYSKFLSNKLEAVLYIAALAITGAIRGTSNTKGYQELGLESLKSCRWFRPLCYFYKIKKLWSPRIPF